MGVFGRAVEPSYQMLNGTNITASLASHGLNVTDAPLPFGAIGANAQWPKVAGVKEAAAVYNPYAYYYPYSAAAVAPPYLPAAALSTAQPPSSVHNLWSGIAKRYEQKSFEPWVISICFYLYAFAMCELARRLVNILVKDWELKYLLYEFIGTLQICGMLYENQYVAKYYGLNAYSTALCLLILLHCYTVGTALGNPCPLFEYYFVLRISTPLLFVGYLASQLAAAFVAFRLAWLFWYLGLSWDHSLNAQSYNCYSPLQVSPVPGLLSEAAAMFTVRVVLLTAIDLFPKFWKLAVALAWAAVVRVGLDLTGFYMNPVLAASQTYGCFGLASWQHICVYWLGPILGWLFATYFYAKLKQKIPKDKVDAIKRRVQTWMRCRRTNVNRRTHADLNAEIGSFMKEDDSGEPLL